MNQKWCVALALSGMAVGAAAQSNVTIYGVVDLSLTHERNALGNVSRMDNGILNGSRLGFKGSEDLGGGLKANFALEMGANVDTGSSAQGGRAFGRQSWVGLSGNFGAVRLGRQYSPIYIAQLYVDPFVGGMEGNMTGAWFDAGGFRIDNAVTYITPTFGGLSAVGMYAFGETANSNKANRNVGFSVGYAAGAIGAQVAYHRTDNAAANDNSHVVFVGGTYDFGPVKLHAAIDDFHPATNAHQRDAMVGLSAPIGVGQVVASYIRKQNRVIDDAGANQWALGYIYNLSKRTALYTSVAMTHNDSNSAVLSGGKGRSDKIADVGLRHIF